MRERFRVTFSLVGILLLFSLTAALVQVPMRPDTFFSVTMATIWFISSKFLVGLNIKTQQPKLTHNNILVRVCVYVCMCMCACAACSAVLQASLFGLVGLFPPRYCTLFMSGQGLDGIFAAVAMPPNIIST